MQPALPQFTIYVLELAEGKYYVGATKNMEERYQQHLSGRGAGWTRAYKPQRVLETSPGNKLDEDRKFKEMVLRFGLDNVRGASYSTVVLSPIAHSALQREIYSIQDRCFRCGKTGHFVETCDREDCKRCGRKHDTVGCHSTVHIEGHPLPPVLCERCGREGHHEDSCRRKHHVDGRELPPSVCRHCGRNTHVSVSCATGRSTPVASSAAGRPPPGFSQPAPVPAVEEDTSADEHTPETGIGCRLS